MVKWGGGSRVARPRAPTALALVGAMTVTSSRAASETSAQSGLLQTSGVYIVSASLLDIIVFSDGGHLMYIHC